MMIPSPHLLPQHYFTIIIIIVCIIGLCIGSLLNVFIVRIPLMLFRQWDIDCREHLKLAPKQHVTYNLFLPRSHCVHCKKPLRLRDNIPLISFILLRGHCYNCHQKISFIYPFVEMFAAFLTVISFIHYGFSLQAVAASILSYALIVLFFIDVKHQLLPNNITIPILWLGLVLNIWNTFTIPTDAILGAAAAYLILWLPSHFYAIIRKRQGMGHGDFKMFAMLGAWFGAITAINILLLAIVIALASGIVLLFFKKMRRGTPMPFGPFLAIGGLVSAICGPFLLQWIFVFTQH